MKSFKSITGNFNLFSVNTKPGLWQKPFKPLLFRILILLVIVFITGCATTGGYKEAVTDDPESTDLKIYGQFDPEFSSTYFGSFKFVFENMTEQWAKAVRLQTNLHSSTIMDIQSTLISAGSNLSSVVGDVSEGIGLEGGNKKGPIPTIIYMLTNLYFLPDLPWKNGCYLNHQNMKTFPM